MWIILLWSPPNPSHLMDPLASEQRISTTCVQKPEKGVFGSFQRRKCAFPRKVSRIGRRSQTFSGKGRRMLERVLQPGDVINPGRRANGGANPAQSVVVTSGGSGRATVWMERGERLRLSQHLRLFFPPSTASGPSMPAAGLDVHSDKLVGREKLVEKKKNSCLRSRSSSSSTQDFITAQRELRPPSANVKFVMPLVMKRGGRGGGNVSWCHHVAQCWNFDHTSKNVYDAGG